MWHQLIRLAVFAVVTVFAFNLAMLVNEDDYIFFPGKSLYRTPAAVALPYKSITLPVSEAVQLHGWFIPAASPQAPVVLQLHGNAGNIGDRLPLYARWHKMGLAVFAFDYRGYGDSSGSPSETGFYQDADAAWRYLTATRGIDPKRIIIDGRSIGAAVASHLAASHSDAAGLVLETPFTSVSAMAAHHYPFFLLRPLIRNRFDTAAHARKVKLPLLIIAARDDTIAPSFMASDILAAAHAPKRMVTMPGGHNDFDLVSERAYRTVWQRWLGGIGISIKPNILPEAGNLRKKTGAP